MYTPALHGNRDAATADIRWAELPGFAALHKQDTGKLGFLEKFLIVKTALISIILAVSPDLGEAFLTF